VAANRALLLKPGVGSGGVKITTEVLIVIPLPYFARELRDFSAN
jgi:hypothetical protein